MFLRRLCLWLSLGALAAPSFAAQRAIPELTGPVIDETGTLSAGETDALASELRLYPPKLQLQIWLISSLQGEPIESLSIRAVDKWKLGTKKEDKGALLLMALDDRKVRIEVGRGLEGDIPDILVGRLIDSVLRPAFRQGAYFAGLQQASRYLFERAGGDAATLPEAQYETRTTPRSSFSNLKLIFILGWVLLYLIFHWIFPRRSRWGSGLWWGGGGGGFGGGGGSWGGGGGGFSGGGASGDW